MGERNDGRQAGGHADNEQEAAVFIGALEPAAVHGSKAGGNERGRAFATGGAARADRDGRGNHLERRNAVADFSCCAMVGGDDRVGAVAFRFRREGVDQEAGDEAAQCCRNRDQPVAVMTDDGRIDTAIVSEGCGQIMRDLAEEHCLRDSQEPAKKQRRTRARDAQDDDVGHATEFLLLARGEFGPGRHPVISYRDRLQADSMARRPTLLRQSLSDHGRPPGGRKFNCRFLRTPRRPAE